MAAIALLGVDGSGAGWSISGSVGLTLAFLVAVAVVLVALIVTWVRKRRWRREVERLSGKP